MNLLQMSVSGGLLISIILLLRRFFRKFLPPKVFGILWDVTAVLLLVPFRIPAPVSIFSFLQTSDALFSVETGIPFSWIHVVWLAGCAICTAFFLGAWYYHQRKFSASEPIRNEFTEKWLAAHPLRRRISIRQSRWIASPLSYGILRPTILLPWGMDWHDTENMEFIVLHEYVHIRRLDAVRKLILAAAVCLHWYHPLVWVMYLMANRDMELSCDAEVLAEACPQNRTAYASMLIRMEETRLVGPTANGFFDGAAHERITSIMRYGKVTFIQQVVSLLLVIAIVAVFGTGTLKKAGDLMTDSQVIIGDPEPQSGSLPISIQTEGGLEMTNIYFNTDELIQIAINTGDGE